MRKGKLGVVVCLYPILGFVCVILNQPLLCALIFGFVLVAERDEWAGRQTLQALGLSAITAVVVHVLHYIGSLFPSYYSGFLALLSKSTDSRRHSRFRCSRRTAAGFCSLLSRSEAGRLRTFLPVLWLPRRRRP